MKRKANVLGINFGKKLAVNNPRAEISFSCQH